MCTLYKLHFFNRISEINLLEDIISPAGSLCLNMHVLLSPDTHAEFHTDFHLSYTCV